MGATGGRLPFLEWGIAGRPMPGETESGDQYVVHPLPDGVLLAVVDGLGHGPDAAAAARDAIAIVQAHSHEPLIPLVKRCHEALRRTNGVVMTLAAFHCRDKVLTWLGVGNVEGLLVRSDVLAKPARDGAPARRGGGLPVAATASVRPGRGPGRHTHLRHRWGPRPVCRWPGPGLASPADRSCGPGRSRQAER